MMMLLVRPPARPAPFLEGASGHCTSEKQKAAESSRARQGSGGPDTSRGEPAFTAGDGARRGVPREESPWLTDVGLFSFNTRQAMMFPLGKSLWRICTTCRLRHGVSTGNSTPGCQVPVPGPLLWAGRSLRCWNVRNSLPVHTAPPPGSPPHGEVDSPCCLCFFLPPDYFHSLCTDAERCPQTYLMGAASLGCRWARCRRSHCSPRTPSCIWTACTRSCSRV